MPIVTMNGAILVHGNRKHFGRLNLDFMLTFCRPKKIKPLVDPEVIKSVEEKLAKFSSSSGAREVEEPAVS